MKAAAASSKAAMTAATASRRDRPRAEASYTHRGQVAVPIASPGSARSRSPSRESAAAEATRNVDIIEDINGSIEYRCHLTQVYVARTIQAALQKDAPSNGTSFP